MKIGMPGFILDRGRSGVASYMTQLVAHLQGVDKINNYEILISEAESKLFDITAPNFTQIIYRNAVEKSLLNIAWYNFQLPLRARSQKYDLIHIPCLRRVGLWKPCKIVATAHDLAAFAVPGKYSWPHMFYQRHIIARTIHRCDHVIAVSHNTKADIIRWMGYPADKITVIYPGIDKKLYSPARRDLAKTSLSKKFGLNDPFIVYVGRIEHPGKNHLRLIQAFELLKRSNPSNYQLVFAGADWHGADVVKEYARKSPYANEIHFLGFVSRKDVVDLYSSCELMAFPSLYEGFGFPLLEAMACGAKVICSNTSSLEEIGRGNALMFDPLSVEGIYRCLLQGNERYDPVKQLENNLKHLENFSWEKSAKAVLKVYQEI